MKIILLGNRGKLGQAFENYLAQRDISFLSLNSNDFDARKPEKLSDIFSEYVPTHVINCVALNGLNVNFLNAGDSFAINSLFPFWLAKKSKEINFVLVHFSTDSVFNDFQQGSFSELSEPGPRSIYGTTKLAGEFFIRANAESFYIVRLPLLFGGNLKCNQLIEKLILKMIGRETVWLNPKLKITPTYIHDIPEAIFDTILACEFGVYHLRNEGDVFLTEFMKEIATAMNLECRTTTSPDNKVIDLDIKENEVILESIKISKMRHHKFAISDYVKKIGQK